MSRCTLDDQTLGNNYVGLVARSIPIATFLFFIKEHTGRKNGTSRIKGKFWPRPGKIWHICFINLALTLEINKKINRRIEQNMHKMVNMGKRKWSKFLRAFSLNLWYWRYQMRKKQPLYITHSFLTVVCSLIKGRQPLFYLLHSSWHAIRDHK